MDEKGASLVPVEDEIDELRNMMTGWGDKTLCRLGDIVQNQPKMPPRLNSGRRVDHFLLIEKADQM
jgi:hypothetical protein